MDVAIINYGMNNLYSVKNACNRFGLISKITNNHEEIMNSKVAILPGVGAFAQAMQILKEKKLNKTILDFIQTGKPFFGICLGMQLLFTESNEFGLTEGLNLIKGKVVKFSSVNYKIPIPQIGWNKIFFYKNEFTNTVLKDNKNEDFMYFVHSYHVIPEEKNVQLTYTKYFDINYCSSIKKENITAFQFHPEKSGINGNKVFQSIKSSLL